MKFEQRSKPISVIQYPMVLIRKYDQSARNSASKDPYTSVGHNVRPRRDILLKGVECTDTFGLWKAIVFASVNKKLRGRPFVDKVRRAVPRTDKCASAKPSSRCWCDPLTCLTASR